MSNFVICLRHGEKPVNAEDKNKDLPLDAEGPGLDANGDVNRESLTARGWRRAQMLAESQLCGQLSRPEAVRRVKFLVPKYVDKKRRDETSEHRPYQTVLAVSRRAGTVPTAVCERDEADTILCEYVAKLEGTAVVCWQHAALVEFANCLASDTAPTDWPQDRFDILWIFHRDAPDHPYSFERVDQDVVADANADDCA